MSTVRVAYPFFKPQNLYNFSRPVVFSFASGISAFIRTFGQFDSSDTFQVWTRNLIYQFSCKGAIHIHSTSPFECISWSLGVDHYLRSKQYYMQLAADSWTRSYHSSWNHFVLLEAIPGKLTSCQSLR